MCIEVDASKRTGSAVEEVKSAGKSWKFEDEEFEGKSIQYLGMTARNKTER